MQCIQHSKAIYIARNELSCPSGPDSHGATTGPHQQGHGLDVHSTQKLNPGGEGEGERLASMQSVEYLPAHVALNAPNEFICLNCVRAGGSGGKTSDSACTKYPLLCMTSWNLLSLPCPMPWSYPPLGTYVAIYLPQPASCTVDGGSASRQITQGVI